MIRADTKGFYEIVGQSQEEDWFAQLEESPKLIKYSHTHGILEGNIVLVMEFQSHHDCGGFGKVELQFHPFREGEEYSRIGVLALWHTGVDNAGLKKAAEKFIEIRDVMSQIKERFISLQEFLDELKKRGVNLS